MTMREPESDSGDTSAESPTEQADLRFSFAGAEVAATTRSRSPTTQTRNMRFMLAAALAAAGMVCCGWMTVEGHPVTGIVLLVAGILCGGAALPPRGKRGEPR